MSKIKEGTKVYIEEVVAESYRCPYCGHSNEPIHYGTMSYDTLEFGETVECESCKKVYILVKEDWE